MFLHTLHAMQSHFPPPWPVGNKQNTLTLLFCRWVWIGKLFLKRPIINAAQGEWWHWCCNLNQHQNGCLCIPMHNLVLWSLLPLLKAGFSDATQWWYSPWGSFPPITSSQCNRKPGREQQSSKKACLLPGAELLPPFSHPQINLLQTTKTILHLCVYFTGISRQWDRKDNRALVAHLRGNVAVWPTCHQPV